MTIPARRKNASNNIPIASNNILRPSKRQKHDDEEDTDDDDDLGNFPKLDTRMSPAKVVKLISNLSAIQIESLKATPFRHFVNCRVTKIPTKIAHYAVVNFNFRDRKLKLDNGETFDVSKEDVHTVLGLPTGGVVPKFSIEDMQPIFTEWINQFGDEASGRLVKMSVVENYIKSHKEDGGPMFKRNILLFIISSLICSHGNEHVFIDAFPWVVDIEKLDELDWCEFVFDKLLETKERWSLIKQFRGPILFLLLHFVDKVVDAKRDVDRTSPTLIGWTTKDLNNRQKKGERRGGFGGGFVQREPPSIQNSSLQTIKKQEEERHETHENVQSILFHEFTCALEKLAAAYTEVDEKGRKLVEARPNDERVKKLIMDSRVTFSLDRPDAVTNFTESESDPTTNVPNNETIPRFSQDTFFDTPSVIRDLDAQTRAKLLIQKLNEVEPPSFSLGLTQEFSTQGTPFNDTKNQAGEEGEKQTGGTEEEQESGDNEDSEEEESGDEEDSEEEEGGSETEDDDDKGDENVLENEVVEELEKGELERKEEKTPKRRCKRQPGRYVKSPYISRNLDPNTFPTKKQMDLAAYLMSKDGHSLLKLFQSGDVATTKDELRTLVTKGSFVAPNVISTFSFILNNREIYKAPSSPGRAFFPIEVVSKIFNDDGSEKSYLGFKSDLDMYLQTWSAFKNVDHIQLFFFPILLHEHFSVACFNLSAKMERYEFLDNKTEGRTSLEKYGSIPSKLQEFLAKWLTSKQLSHKAFRVRTLKPIRLQMKWRDQTNHNDSAIYTMRHMETYKGNGLEGWDVGLEKGKFKPLHNLRIKYAFEIVNYVGNEVKSNACSLVEELVQKSFQVIYYLKLFYRLQTMYAVF